MKSIDHAHLGLRSTACNDQRQSWKCINLLISEFVKLAGSHDHGVCDISCHSAEISRQDSHLLCNCFGSARVIASDHVDNYTSFIAGLDRAGCLWTRGIIQANQSQEAQIMLCILTFQVGIFEQPCLISVRSMGQSQYSKSQLGEFLHVLEDLVAVVVGHGHGGRRILVPDHRGA